MSHDPLLNDARPSSTGIEPRHAPSRSPLLTVAGVAAILQTTDDEVLELIRSNRLRAHNISRSTRPRWRISEEALDVFLESTITTPRPQKRKQRLPAVPDYLAS